MTDQVKLGLTSAEAAERKRQGMANDVEMQTSRSLTDILKANLLSIANITLLSIVLILLALGKFAEAFATGGVVIVNILLGAFQEYRAKRKLDQIALLTRPKVTVLRDSQPTEVNQSDVVVGDVIILNAGDQAVVDGKLLEDPRAENPRQRVDMDESLLTGESDLIAKYPGDEILSGSFCVVGSGIFVAERVGNESYAQKLTKGAREYTRVYTPLQKQIGIIVRVLVIVALFLSGMLGLKAAFNEVSFGATVEEAAVAISLIPQGLLLMITVAYALGALRIARQDVLVQQINAVESLSHVDVLCLDKTGTLTTNRILFDAIHPLNGMEKSQIEAQVGDYIATTGANNRTAEAISQAIEGNSQPTVSTIPFSSARKWAAASFENGQYQGTYILGAPEMVLDTTSAFQDKMDELSAQGLRVLLFAQSPQIIKPDDIPEDREPNLPDNVEPIALLSFSDELRPNVKDVLANFRKAGITLKLISGDNPDTVAALARQAGFSKDDLAISGKDLAHLSQLEFEEAVRQNAIFGRITPEQKQAIVAALRKDECYVAMMGDGVNDVLSLKQSQVGIAMEDGSQATRSVADIVLLGNRFESLPKAFLEGQRILNGMNDVNRLFLTRTFYTVLLIIIVGFIGTEFPFTPLHNALLTTLPVGIPAFFLTAWAKSGKPKRDLITSMTQFVLPAGLSFTFVTLFIWILYRTYGEADVETSRSVLTTAALLGGLWIILLVDKEDAQGFRLYLEDMRRVVLAIAMLVTFLIVMAIPTVREFFEMTTLSWADLATIAASMTAWAIALDVIWRHRVFQRLMIPDYGKPDAPQIKLEIE
ncbi:MAG: HAD-IC family P-type ATPase [Chloroflexi bacterium]|nr:HAD-IC family P-type ATPase [Chloroflexota bacterium]